jgi:hypothetical protein
MASVFISNCVNNKSILIRPTLQYPIVSITKVFWFDQLYKWPESEVEFVKTINSNNYRDRVEVDSLSCRQVYLRSYKFSRKKLSVTEKTINYLSSVKESVICASNILYCNSKGNRKILWRAKYITHAAASVYHRLLSRSDKVHVARHDF